MLLEINLFDRYVSILLEHNIDDFDIVNKTSILEPVGILCHLDYDRNSNTLIQVIDDFIKNYTGVIEIDQEDKEIQK